MRNYLRCVFPAAAWIAVGCGGDDTGGSGGALGSTVTASGTSAQQTSGVTSATTTAVSTVSATTQSTATTGMMLQCGNLSDMPTVSEIGMAPFLGSEDFTFDGKGNMVAKKGGAVVRVDAAGAETPFAPLAQSAFGLRFALSGKLIVALPNAGRIVELAEGGMAVDYVTGLQGPNGIFPDMAGNVWATEFSGGRVIKIDSNKMVTEIADANSPNGVMYDDMRSVVFFTEYQSGRIYRVNPDGSGKTEIERLNGTAPDGLAMDACGNLYAVDNDGNALWRIRLDAMGNSTGATEIATFNASVANASFGRGQGFDANSIYVGGGQGRIFRVEVGVPGAMVVLPP